MNIETAFIYTEIIYDFVRENSITRQMCVLDVFLRRDETLYHENYSINIRNDLYRHRRVKLFPSLCMLEHLWQTTVPRIKMRVILDLFINSTCKPLFDFSLLLKHRFECDETISELLFLRSNEKPLILRVGKYETRCRLVVQY